MSEAKIGDIAELKTGPFGTQLHSNEYVKSGIPIINVKNIGYGELICNDLDYVSELTANRLKEHRLLEGDIVFGRKGSIDRHAYISKECSGWLQGSDCIRVRCLDKKKINPKFLSHFFNLDYVKRQLNAGAVGSTMASMNTDILKRVKVLLPDIEVQNTIERVLSTINDKIANNTSICSDLESMAKLIYDYWFVQFDFPDENGRPYKSSGGKMIWNEELKREIPEGWEVKHASDLTKVRTGKEDANFATVDGNYAYFTCGQDILKCDFPSFEGRAVLLAGNGDFNVKHYTGKFNAYQRTYVLIPDDEKYYALLYIATKEAIKKFVRGSAGSIVKFITLGDVNGISLLDPHDDNVLKKFNLILDKIEQIRDENEQLASLRDFLLPMLMNGQVKVKS